VTGPGRPAAPAEAGAPRARCDGMLVDIWSDVVCPWCYLGSHRLAKALSRFEHAAEVEVRHRAFELDPSAVTDGTAVVDHLSAKYHLRRTEAEQAQRDMEKRAAADGLTFRMDALEWGNTRDAHRLLQLAHDRGHQAELAEALHRAYFTEQRSVFDHHSLTAIAAGVGLDAGEVRAVLAGDEYADAVRAEEDAARDLGVQGVPFFVLDRRFAVSGAQPVEVLLAALTRAWDEPAGDTVRG
jgi:predicted DsbA family dithiol-disulfide isomerase